MTDQQTDMRAVRPLRAQVQEVPEHEDRDQVARIAEQMRIETGFGDDGLRIGTEVLQETTEFLCDAQVDEAAGGRAFGPSSSTRDQSLGGGGGTSGGGSMTSFPSAHVLTQPSDGEMGHGDDLRQILIQGPGGSVLLVASPVR